MKTILVSISLLIFSILLVIGCEVIDKNLQEDHQQETRVIQQTSNIEKTDHHEINTELTDYEVNTKENLQKSTIPDYR